MAERLEVVPTCVDELLAEAIELGASDLYCLPGEKEYELRVRVSGSQRALKKLPVDFGLQCITRIKVLGGLLTYRTNIAQDGSFEFGGTSIRVASMPTLSGERLTLRFLGHVKAPQYIEECGFSSEIIKTLKRVLQQPQGLVILTGATGSGKTTLLYCMLRELLRQKQDPASIISLEDPVERHIKEISQVEVSTEREWDYEAALKAALRQDVRTLLIGEMRDAEVVKVTLDAALSGHRILTTYHAGDIPSIYARLLHRGVEPFLLAAAINAALSLELKFDKNSAVYKPVINILEVDDEWRQLVVSKPDIAHLRELAEQKIQKG